jgi:hypothetical protein
MQNQSIGPTQTKGYLHVVWPEQSNFAKSINTVMTFLFLISFGFSELSRLPPTSITTTPNDGFKQLVARPAGRLPVLLDMTEPYDGLDQQIAKPLQYAHETYHRYLRSGRRRRTQDVEMDHDPNCVGKIRGTSDSTWADVTPDVIEGRAAWWSTLNGGAVDVSAKGNGIAELEDAKGRRRLEIGLEIWSI